jgi:hypothetical protein
MRKGIYKNNDRSQALVAHACLATQEAEIRRIMVQSQPRQTVHETLSQKKKKKNHKKRVAGVTQGIGPEFKL